MRRLGFEACVLALAIAAAGAAGAACNTVDALDKEDAAKLDLGGDEGPKSCEQGSSTYAFSDDVTGSCYRWLSDGASWSQARTSCSARGFGDLAVVSDQAELEAVTAGMVRLELATAFEPYAVWIGLRSDDLASWYWLEPGQPAGWMGGWNKAGSIPQPNETTPPICAYLYAAATYAWHDAGCETESYSILCEE